MLRKRGAYFSISVYSMTFIGITMDAYITANMEDLELHALDFFLHFIQWQLSDAFRHL